MVRPSMKTSMTLLLMIAVAACAISCQPHETAGRDTAPPAYAVGSAEFDRNAPPRFHSLAVGMNEEMVSRVVGRPTTERPLMALGQMGKAVGKRQSYSLGEARGIVWVDYDTNQCVTGVFWRERD